MLFPSVRRSSVGSQAIDRRFGVQHAVGQHSVDLRGRVAELRGVIATLFLLRKARAHRVSRSVRPV